MHRRGGDREKHRRTVPGRTPVAGTRAAVRRTTAERTRTIPGRTTGSRTRTVSCRVNAEGTRATPLRTDAERTSAVAGRTTDEGTHTAPRRTNAPHTRAVPGRRFGRHTRAVAGRVVLRGTRVVLCRGTAGHARAAPRHTNGQRDPVQQLPERERHHAQHGGERVAFGGHREQGECDTRGAEHRRRPGGQRSGTQRARGGAQDEGDDRAGTAQEEHGRDGTGDQGRREQDGPGRHVPAHQRRTRPHHGLGTQQEEREQPVVSSLHDGPRLWPQVSGPAPAEGGFRPLTWVTDGQGVGRPGGVLHLRFHAATVPRSEARSPAPP